MKQRTNLVTVKPEKPAPTNLVGAKVQFAEEKRKYTIRAHNDRYFICTRKQFKTVVYTIVDVQERIRGTENLVFCMGFETDKDCLDALERLKKGESEISHRNRIPAIVHYVTADIRIHQLTNKLLDLQ